MNCNVSCFRQPPGFVSRISIILEFLQFLRHRKKYWIAPIVVVLLLLSLLIVVTEGSALSPFIYALF